MNTPRRLAVLIGNCQYPNFSEDDLPTLDTPRNDVAALKTTLKEPARGNFGEVTCLQDAASQDVRDAVARLIRSASEPNTMGLIYYSGHGLLDPEDRLHLALHDSEPGMWSRTLPMSDIARWISLHKPFQLVLLLDCCYSGAGLRDLEVKGRGSSAVHNFQSALTNSLETVQGTGVVMITATTPIQQAVGDKKSGFGVFTRHLLNGLETGAPKRGKNKFVTVRDLYSYITRKMSSTGTSQQTPMLWGAQAGGDFLLSGTGYLGENAKPTKVRYSLLRRERKPVLDLVGPSYILDPRFHFLDWNTSFEHFIARPLQLKRREHVRTFLDKLQNSEDVQKRSNLRFRSNAIPPVDIEKLELESREYGLMIFDKIATQIVDTRGRVIAWCVNLNVSSVQRHQRFWRKMEQNLQRDLNWSKYATQYDKIIVTFPEYQALVQRLLDLVGECTYCLDLGAGTGTVTLEFLKRDPDVKIVAIEKNETMLDCFQRKLDAIADVSIKDRAILYKGDITTCLRQEEDDSFDGCVMLNVLFALDYPQDVLAEVFRVLRPGSALTLSTSHMSTDVTKLFSEIQKSLIDAGQFDPPTEYAWNEAQNRNIEMNDIITRHSLDDIKAYLLNAGFEIEVFEPGNYIDCVVIIKANKPL